MGSRLYDVVLVPPKHIAAKAIEASRQVESLGTKFTLQDGVLFPHLSLYIVQLDDSNLDKVQSILQKLAQKIAAIEMNPKAYSYIMDFLFLEYETNAKVRKLHEAVIDEIAPLRDGMPPKDAARLDTLPDKQKQNLEQFGWRFAGDLYHAHISITRFIEKQDIVNLKLPDAANFAGQFDRLGLFEVGENGTCTHKVAEFKVGV